MIESQQTNMGSMATKCFVPGKPVLLGERSGTPGCAMSIGLATREISDKINEDFCGVSLPPEDDSEKGMMIAIADGVSAGGAGRLAAETVAQCLFTDYYSVAQGKPVALILEQLLRATNAWMFGQNHAGGNNQVMLSTVSALLLRGRQFHVAHVGDTRIYRIRSRRRRDTSISACEFEQLTIDHTWPGLSMHRILKRAIGLDTHLVVDFLDGVCEPGDAFLLVSDGVWDTLGEKQMVSLFKNAADPQSAADALVNAACELQASYLGRNDASAIVASVLPLPS